MGEQLINYYRLHVKKTWKLAFVAAFLCCILVHIYKFTNTLPNFDSVVNVYINQDMTISGRWFLQYACGISSYFDLPWMIGFLCAVYFGLIAVVIVELFEIKNPIIIVLTAGILTCNPSTTEIVFFEYTADGYILGLLFSALSALLSCKSKKIKHSVFSGVFVCLSCAIYQSNISFGAVLCVCFFLNTLFSDGVSIKEAIKWITKHVLIYVVSLAVYYGIWKCMLSIKNLEATDYLGISSISRFSSVDVLRGIYNSLIYFRNFFLDWTLLDKTITPYTVFNVLFLVMFIAVLVVATVKSKIFLKPGCLVLAITALAVIMPIISVWGIFSIDIYYLPRMLHGVCVLYIFAMILYDKWVDMRFSTLFGFLIAVIVFNFAIMANISYQYLDDSYEKSYYIGSRMMEEIESFEDNQVREIAFVGSREEEAKISNSEPGHRIHLLAHQLYSDLMYHHSRIYPFMESVFDLDIPSVSLEKREELELHPDVLKMGIWPSNDSIQIVEDVLVIRIGQIDNPK